MVNLSAMTGIAATGTAPTVALPGGTNATPEIAGATADGSSSVPPSRPRRALQLSRLWNTEFDLCVAVEGDGVDICSLFGGLPQELQAARRIRMFDVLFNPARTAFISMPRRMSDTAIRVRYGGFPD